MLCKNQRSNQGSIKKQEKINIMKENISENIEQYIKGELSEDERISFENKLKSDKELSKEVAFELSIISQYKNKGEQIDKENIEKLKLIEINKSFRNKTDTKKVICWSIISSMAACIIILISFNIYSNYMMNSAFDDYYTKADYNESLSRGNDSNNNIKVEEYYKNGNFKELIDYYISTKDSNICIDQLLVSIAYIETNNLEKAIELLNREINKGDINPNYQSAYWYLALAYTKAHEKVNAIKILDLIIIQDSFYKEKAIKLKKRLI